MAPFENNEDNLLFGLFGTLSLDDDDDDDYNVDSCGEQPNLPFIREPQPVALKGVSINVQSVDFVAEVIVEQSYRNDLDRNVEAVYHFPIDESASVCAFQAKYDDGTIVNGIIQEKNQARQTYTVAKQQGKQANLLESTKRDILTLRVGNLAAGQSVSIRLTYVTTLQAQDDAMALILPTYLAPRYCSPTTWMPNMPTLIKPTDGTKSNIELEAMNPPATSRSGLYKLDVVIRIQCHSVITKVVPAYHDVGLLTDGLNTCVITEKKATITLSDVNMDRDLVLLVHEISPHQPRVCLEKTPDNKSLAGFVTLRPDLLFGDVNREFIFLVDRSGSMGSCCTGSSKTQIEQAGEALGLFLRSLPPTCTFNVVGFGTCHSSLFGTPRPYSDGSLDEAARYAASLRADMGGTELSAALEHVLSMPSPLSSRIGAYTDTTKPFQRQVFILTDGQVSNDNQVFDIISRYTKHGHCRVFSLGLGTHVSRHLVKGMALAGKGTAKFVDGRDSNALRTSVLGQLKQSLQPALDDVTIEWSFSDIDSDPKPPSSETVKGMKSLLGYRSPTADPPSRQGSAQSKPFKLYPRTPPPIFSGERFLSYAMFNDASRLPTGVTVKCASPDGQLELKLDVNTAEDVYHGWFAHRLAVKTAIAEFEDSSVDGYGHHQNNLPDASITADEALRMALSYNLLSNQTSFVGISEKPVVVPGSVAEKQTIPQTTYEEQKKQTPASKFFYGSRMTWAFPDSKASGINAQPVADLCLSAVKTKRKTHGFAGIAGTAVRAMAENVFGSNAQIEEPTFRSMDMASGFNAQPVAAAPMFMTARCGSTGGSLHSHVASPKKSSGCVRAERLQREQKARMQKSNSVWDEIDQRWVGQGTPAAPPSWVNLPKKKKIGIKMDHDAMIGKSVNVAQKVNERIGTMEESAAKAIAETRARESVKRQKEEEEDKIRLQLEPKIKVWSEEYGKKKPIRALLVNLHIILWPGAKWKQISIGDIMDDSKVKKFYLKAILVVHPDKTENLPAEWRFLAKRIFDALTQAKADFDARKSSGAPSSNHCYNDDSFHRSESSLIPSDAMKYSNPTTMEKERLSQRPNTKDGDSLLQLCLKQNANGSFPCNSEVARLVCPNWEAVQLQEQAVTNGGVDEVVWATIMAITVMRWIFSKDKAIWELQVQKAEAFLCAEIGKKQMEYLLPFASGIVTQAAFGF